MNDDKLFREALRRQNEQAAKMKMPADLEQRVMERIMARPVRPVENVAKKRVARTARIRWRWAAACLLALVGMGSIFVFYQEEQPAQPIAQQQEQPIAPANSPLPTQKDRDENRTSTVYEPYKHRVRAVQAPCTNRTSTMYETKTNPMAQQIDAELPDTLGEGLWKREENVVRALQLLAECEASSSQAERNVIVEAAFRSMPKPDGLQLVVSECGDYLVVNDSQPQIIEL